MSARPWSRACSASSTACCPSASRGSCATSPSSRRTCAGAIVPTVAEADVADLRPDAGSAGQGDQLRQRDRGRAGAAAMAARCSCSRRRGTISPASSPARIRGRSWLDWLDARRATGRARSCDLPQARSEAELAAVAWACEMTALEAAADADRRRRSGLISTGMLGDIDGCARASCRNSSASMPPDEQLSAIASGPLMRRYSKATGIRIQPGSFGATCLPRRTTCTAADIDSALAMLDAAAETAPLLRKALDRAQAES